MGKEYGIFDGERIDPSMLSLSYLLNQPEPKYGHKHTPWGMWHTLEIHQERYRFVNSLGDLGQILDVACGTGYGERLIKSSNYVVGVDLSYDALVFGRGMGSGRQYAVNANATSLPFGNDTFDTVVSFETMEHIPLDQVPHYLSEVQRVLGNSGRFVVSVPNRVFNNPGTSIDGSPVNPYHFFEPTIEDFQDLLSPHFQHIDYYYQTGKIFTPRNSVLGKMAKLPRVLQGRYARVNPLSDLNEGLEIPSTFIAVCRN
ncbi:class I SAM-dependent methyltransferase [Candidatus Woesebacteria bacterium]|nr:MAG: class I SAM-dependent methyltransferase [Candidatus Woesebacteria bacterium]